MTDNTAPETSATAYIAYPAAIKWLAAQWGATTEELAGWIWLGPKEGGLAAYRNANELADPPQVAFLKDEPLDYLSLLGGCWFNRTELEKFVPSYRFISGKALKGRWEKLLDIPVESFTQAKIEESRLLDFPIFCGSASNDASGDQSSSWLDSVLFMLGHVEAIEAEDINSDISCQPQSSSFHSEKLTTYFSELGSRGAEALHGQPGGSREKREKVCQRWASGQFSSRKKCAETVCHEIGISPSVASKALQNTPDPD